MGAIDAYVAELSGALRGPRRAKADLLTEARDSLVDAAEAYERSGLPREVGERRAVAEFGEVREVAPGYQAELSLAQGRRTALLVLCVLAAQPLAWSWVSRSLAPPGAVRVGPGYALMSQAVNWLGGAGIAGALLAALACGVGVRYLGARPGLARATGFFALAVCGVFAVSGALLTAASPADALHHGTGLLWPLVLLAAPLAWVAASARRCLAAT